MATKKKTLDAVASSRRWRQATSRLLSKITPEEQLAFLNRRLANWPGAAEPKGRRTLAHR